MFIPATDVIALKHGIGQLGFIINVLDHGSIH
jgi:hypothetical protein